MRVIRLAGGKGTRLKPFTTILPKPLVPIGGTHTILEIIIKQLVNNGFTHITLAVNHMAQLIQAYFGDGSQYGVKIDYSLESKELSTIGPLTLIKDLPQNFLVMNGDILCNLDYKNLLNNHIKSKAEITVSSFKRVSNIDFGVIVKDKFDNLKDFVEKPKYHHEVSMGIYCLSKNVIEALTFNERYGFDNLMLDSIALNRNVKIITFEGYWLDIGRTEDYDYANENFNQIQKLLKLN